MDKPVLITFYTRQFYIKLSSHLNFNLDLTILKTNLHKRVIFFFSFSIKTCKKAAQMEILAQDLLE
jgi:hypothetical protein